MLFGIWCHVTLCNMFIAADEAFPSEKSFFAIQLQLHFAFWGSSDRGQGWDDTFFHHSITGSCNFTTAAHLETWVAENKKNKMFCVTMTTTSRELSSSIRTVAQLHIWRRTVPILSVIVFFFLQVLASVGKVVLSYKVCGSRGSWVEVLGLPQVMLAEANKEKFWGRCWICSPL